jgi:hypothetical protein
LIPYFDKDYHVFAKTLAPTAIGLPESNHKQSIFNTSTFAVSHFDEVLGEPPEIED